MNNKQKIISGIGIFAILLTCVLNRALYNVAYSKLLDKSIYQLRCGHDGISNAEYSALASGYFTSTLVEVVVIAVIFALIIACLSNKSNN